jgi:hypothetical protein
MMRIVLLAMTVMVTGCVRPGDRPTERNCVWIEEDNRPLHLESAPDRHHLRNDAVTAEDVAIRWADQYYGHTPEYDRRRNECMEALFNGLATNHRVDVALVRQYRFDRDIVLDAIVMISFGALYVVVAYYFAGRIRRRFPPGEAGFWIMALAMAMGVSLVGVLLGNIWAVTIETLRLNSVHLSYRMDRIPWRQHWPELLICGFVIFGLVALIRSRSGVRRS